MKAKRPFTPLQLLIHLLAWLPLLLLLWDYSQGQLGLNPVRAITLRTGKTALILLLLSLAITPLHLIFGWKWVYPLRRPLGLYAFLYAGLHFLTFVGLDYGFDFALVIDSLRSNRFTLYGLASFLIMLPMALTSTRRTMLWLGEKRWRWLHRWAYLAAALAVLHYTLLVRQYYTQPIIFGSILAVLLAIRLFAAGSKRRRLA
jgi:methionine sulfoxide reductase heme-binding subunit